MVKAIHPRSSKGVLAAGAAVRGLLVSPEESAAEDANDQCAEIITTAKATARRTSEPEEVMGWLRLVVSTKLQVSFAEYRLFYRALLQKRPIV